MSKGKSKKKQPSGRAPESGRKKGLQIFAVVAGVVLVLAAVVVFYLGKGNGNKGEKETVRTQAPFNAEGAKSDIKKLVGRWLRPDGGYILEISKVRANGPVDARYLNPRPIKVSVAEASYRGEELKVFIELQDAGYPGSTYTLTYDPQRDLLGGTYFQAALQQTFEVVFIRTK